MDSAGFTLRLVDWEHARQMCAVVRFDVFVTEQGVPAEIELDALDEVCLHALALDSSGKPVGTGRLLPDGHIGRMAVLKAWRGKGVGAALLSALEQSARQRGDAEICLSAQTHATGFYGRAGYVAEGEAYIEAGIPHVTMRKRLADAPSSNHTAHASAKS